MDALHAHRILEFAREAATLLGASDALFRSTGAVPDPDDRVEIDAALGKVKSKLGAAEFGHAWSTGTDLALEDAVHLALEPVDAR